MSRNVMPSTSGYRFALVVFQEYIQTQASLLDGSRSFLLSPYGKMRGEEIFLIRAVTIRDLIASLKYCH